MKGSVRKPRSSGGTWSYRIDLGFDDSGRWRQREISGFRTKKEAEAALSAALADAQRGTYAPPSRMLRLAHRILHRALTRALEAGVHPEVVQEQLGHSAIAVTLDTYSDVPQAVRRDSADKIAGMFE